MTNEPIFIFGSDFNVGLLKSYIVSYVQFHGCQPSCIVTPIPNYGIYEIIDLQQLVSWNNDDCAISELIKELNSDTNK